jgi:hypothetical protein
MRTGPPIRWHSFSLPKEGDRPDEYEDAWAGNTKSSRFAVADGAAESSFASLWAQLLVEGFVAPREGQAAEGWFPPLQQRWAQAVDKLELEWFGEDKRRLGAFATFLGLSLRKPHGGRDGLWNAKAVGDCCIFQVRDDRLLVSFPISRPADFTNRPLLLCSRPGAKAPGEPLSQAKHRTGRWQAGDRFLLMTDALAQWFLSRQQDQGKPWQSLIHRLAMPNADAVLTIFVEQLRRHGELKNDDITLLVIEL